MAKNKSHVRSAIRPLITIALFLLVWWVAEKAKWLNPLFIPSLNDLGRSFLRILSTPQIYSDMAATIFRALAGLILSTLVSVPLGLVLGRFPKLYEFFELPVDFFRSIPSSSLFFLFILFFGIGDTSKVAVVFYGCSLIMLVNTVYGAKPTREKQDRIDMLRSFGASAWQIFHLSVFRDALPHIMAGLRICVSLSLVLVVITEMFLTAASGLGRQIYDFYLAYRVPEMYVVIILLGIIGFCVNKFALFFERRVSFWHPN